MTRELGFQTRRRWLSGMVLGGLGFGARARAEAGREVDEIQTQARAAGLRFEATETEHYLGVGDAPKTFRARALEISKALATTYVKHFRDKGFPVELPRERLTVIALKDRTSYEKFLGAPPGENDGGHFNLDTNRLVIFDFRPKPGGNDPSANAERVNMYALVHEGLHQLTFNTGLLNRKGDVPVCLSEGLATYGELWRPSNPTQFGKPNSYRLDVLRQAPNPAGAWIPLETLVADDKSFDDPEQVQVAYAQSWLLVYTLLKTPALLPKFRAYLDALRPRRDAQHRLVDASTRLGDLDRLDRALKKSVTGL